MNQSRYDYAPVYTLTTTTTTTTTNTNTATSPYSYRRYDYALVYTGTLRHCVATRGKCVSVPGTDISERACVNYDCSDVEITCPPPQAAGRMCPGFDESGACDTVVDDLGKTQAYNTQ